MPTTETAKLKVKFGIRKAYYAVWNDSGSTPGWGTPKALPGAVSASMERDDNNTVFRADDTNYYVSGSNKGYSGANLELAVFPDDFRKDCLGEVADSDGVLYEPLNPVKKKFALAFENQGVADDGSPMSTLIWIYNCTAAGISSEAETTGEDGNEPKTETLTFDSEPNDLGHIRAKLQTAPLSTNTKYTGWFTSVKTYSANTGDA